MALDSRDKLITAVAGGSLVPIYKSSLANQAAGYITALWKATGTYLWGAGSNPTTFAVCDDTLTGGISLPSFSTSKGYILKFTPIGATINTWMIHDRLGHMGGLDATATGQQTLGPMTLTTASGNGRCASDGSDVEWFAEMYTDIGTSAQTCTITYTDQTDTSRTCTISLGGTSPLNRASRCVQIIPNAGQTIKSLVYSQLGGSTGTAGNYGFTARKKLCAIGQYVANIAPPGCDAVSLGIPEIKETSCLELLCLCSTTSTGILYGDMKWGLVA